MGQCLSIAVQLLSTPEEAGKDQQQQQQQPSAAAPTTPSSGLSPVYPSLPRDAEQVPVRNVYDGDTLTLTDERRVRFLGVDTPEIKEKQPYAQEAKAYTKGLCDKKDIWISYEPGQEKQDHYGRLLCFVWVKQGNGYLCVNEGLVHEGFANAYIPNKNSKLHNWDKLLKLQNQARSAKRGLWSSFQDATVYKTANGSAYHKRDCKHLEGIRNLTELKASEASAQGLHPCRTCLGD